MMNLTPGMIISSMKYDTQDNFLRDSALCKETGAPVYDAKLVLSLVPKALASAKNDIEKIAIKEQELLAALNTGELELAKRVYNELIKTFPFDKYKKTKLYRGLIHEAEGELEEAKKIYTSIDENIDYYPQFRKRLISLHLAKGDRVASIQSLIDYLNISGHDSEAWSMLAKLYLHESMFKTALHCYEELSMLNPQSHVLAARCGDLVYTLGRYDIALKYYCKSLFHFPDYPHALYGILITAKKLIIACNDEYFAAHGHTVYPNDSIYYNTEKTQTLLKIAHERLKILYSSDKTKLSKGTIAAISEWLES